MQRVSWRRATSPVRPRWGAPCLGAAAAALTLLCAAWLFVPLDRWARVGLMVASAVAALTLLAAL
jgi:hypothetical protein